jgi:hypothetical protein
MGELRWKVVASSLDDFPAVLEALSVHLDMMALVLCTAEGKTVETHHNHLGEGHILTMVAQNMQILAFCCLYGTDCESC